MKPILFNTEMVRAIRNNNKTVTRRPVRPHYRDGEAGFHVITNARTGAYARIEYYDNWENDTRIMPEPYHSGDILYVRETWAAWSPTYGMAPELHYRADGEDLPGIKWRPSIHMPREAARLFLRVTDVRAEKLQSMLPCDIQREGCPYIYSGFDEEQAPDWDGWMKNVWNSTIKPADRDTYGWDANPWVRVVSFERISKREALESAFNVAANEFIAMQKKIESGQFVEVVRCKDCKNHRLYMGRDMCAKNAKLLDGHEVGLRGTNKDGFCSYVERK